ncbi:uncharacterized protein LOC127699849 isoform X2 [Mytilus californianus]|uniref:uncharacterized protein LOC127699849 isoform X2 n=1 Tax=Mytilus californianus TaxID=6549 RepID=UPI00224697C2|nr:uncharacterized protein LOC127699849 isoform X2 [Mytilus californianus]XP_052059196.1 uncharacterized protein LOC127699849 isoform X2 [Mytilus californianus]
MADSKLCVGCQRGNEDIKAESWCSDCSEPVCKICTRVHERMFPAHKIILLTEKRSIIEKVLQDLGTINVEHVQVPMSVLDIDQQVLFPVKPQGDQRKLSLTNSFQTRVLGDNVCIYKGCFIPGNRLILSQYLQSNLFVCERDGSNPKVINLDYIPECITLYDNNQALVPVGGESVQIIDLTSLKLGRIIKVGRCCYGITSVKDKIWVNGQPKTLSIVDINGKVLKTIRTTFNPWDICANKDGDIFCLHDNSDKVFVVTSDGKEREIYSSPDLDDSQGVAVDHRGDVYVVGRGSNNIHIISDNGQGHDIVLTADDGINLPGGLSYNYETRELLVINNNYETVNIYKTQ